LTLILNRFEEWIASNSSDEQIIQQEKEKKIISTLHQILSPFMLRRTKGEVGLDLPPKKEVLIYAPSTLTQQALYETAINLLKDGKVYSLSSTLGFFHLFKTKFRFIFRPKVIISL
jgi:SNF2 family DNA or RNA helicase